MLKLGIAVDNLSANQLSYYILRQIHDKKTTDFDIVLFFNKLTRPCITSKATTLHISEMWDYDGIVVATDLNTAQKLIHAPRPQKKYFYIWNLEWRQIPQDYISLFSVYGNKNLSLITRSEEYRWLIKNNWNRDSKILDNCHLPTLLKIIQ